MCGAAEINIRLSSEENAMLTTTRTCISILATSVLAATQGVGQSTPPKAPVRPVTDNYFGTPVVDNYRWMEDRDSPDMQRWMKAQADFTRTALDTLPGYAALLKHVAELGNSQPAVVSDLQICDGRYYTLRTPAGAQSAKLYVRDRLQGIDRLLIDPDKLRVGADTHLNIHGYRPSPDGRYVADRLSPGGSEEPVMHIFDVKAGKDLAETADRTYGDPPFWRQDSKSFFLVGLHN
jgi:prolyl oligopeptidase